LIKLDLSPFFPCPRSFLWALRCDGRRSARTPNRRRCESGFCFRGSTSDPRGTLRLYVNPLGVAKDHPCNRQPLDSESRATSLSTAIPAQAGIQWPRIRDGTTLARKRGMTDRRVIPRLRVGLGFRVLCARGCAGKAARGQLYVPMLVKWRRACWHLCFFLPWAVVMGQLRLGSPVERPSRR